MEIIEVTENKKEYLTLLLLADEQEDMIDRYLMPIDLIFRECDGRLIASCGVAGKVESFGELLDGVELLLSPELCDELRRFADGLGHGWRESQLRLCDDCILRLSRERDRLVNDLPRSRRASVTLAVCISAGIAILFI